MAAVGGSKEGAINVALHGIRKGLAGLLGAITARRTPKSKSRNSATRWAVGASVVAGALAGRWLLYPFLGAGKLNEPREAQGKTRRIRRPDGTELHVEIFGPDDGRTLVLTHGWGHDEAQWYYLTRDLAKRFRLIVWDLPGAGRSSAPPDNDYSVEKMARDLESVVGLAGGPAVLVGHSLGGLVTQTFCRLFPEQLGERVAGLVLMDTTYTNPMKTARASGLWRAIQGPVLVPMWLATIGLSPLARAMNWLSFTSGIMHLMKRLTGFAGNQTWRQIDFSSRMTARSRPAVDARIALATLRFDEWNTLSGIPVPVLVLFGENDRVTTPETHAEMAQRLPQGQLVGIPGAGHYALFEQHEAVSQAVADFVESCWNRFGRKPADRSARVEQLT